MSGAATAAARYGEQELPSGRAETAWQSCLPTDQGREILDGVWGPDFVAESNIVDRHIRSLRVKLQNDYRHPRFIATVPGHGYRFIPTFSNAGWVVEQQTD